MSFKEEVAKLEAKVENTEFDYSMKIENRVFSMEAQEEIGILAKGLGMPQALPRDCMFEVVKTKKGATYLAAPSITGKDEELFVKWHTYEFKFIKDDAFDYDIEVKEEGFPGITLYVTYVDEEKETEVSYGFRFRLQQDVSLPTAGVLKRQFKTNPHSLAKYCRNDTPINSLKDAPDSFTVVGVRQLSKADGETLYVLDTDFGSYWAASQCANLEVPAKAVVEGSTVKIEQSAGVLEVSFGSYGKMRDLEIGEYKCTDYKRQTSDLYGEQVLIKLEDGKWYNANSTVTKVINAFEPTITEDKPAILKVQDKKIMKTGNTKVICQFVIGEQEDDDFDKSFGNWLNFAKDEAPLPF